MAETSDGAALAVSRAYHEAWTTKTFDDAVAFVDPAIVCDAPAGRLEGLDAFRAFMEPFTKILTRSELVAAFGDDARAVLVYDTDTIPVRDAPGAEYHEVRDGRISYLRIIFDRLPFEEARRASAP